jgi:hypothetical protein
MRRPGKPAIRGPWITRTLPSRQNLSPGLLLNGSIVAPVAWYNGVTASAAGWASDTYGEALSRTAGAVLHHTYGAASPLSGPLDGGINCNGEGTSGNVDIFVGATSFCNLGTDDQAGEVIFQADSFAGAGTIAQKLLIGTPFGWRCMAVAGTPGTFTVYLWNTSSKVISSAQLATGTLYHAMWFLDRSGSGQVYINGARSGSATDISSMSAVNFNDTSTAFAMTSNNARTQGFDGRIFHLGLWQGAGMLDSHLQDALVLERYRNLMAI